jgi:cytolysin (calcineurin-like family phosphatase)
MKLSHKSLILLSVAWALSFATGAYSAERKIVFALSADQHFGGPTYTNNLAVVQAMWNLPLGWTNWGSSWTNQALGDLRGVVGLGDCTDGGTAAQWEQYSRIYASVSNGGQMPCPVYEGYGNHDLSTNVWLPMAERNAQLKDMRLSANRQCYSWDWQDVHFVQLNLYPGTAAKCLQSYEFLTNDLATCVGNSGRPVILFHHYGFDTTVMKGEWWPTGSLALYSAAISNYNVTAIFSGHMHGAGPFKFGSIPAYNISSAGVSGQFGVVMIENTNVTVRCVSAVVSNQVLWTWTCGIAPPQAPVFSAGISEKSSQLVTVTGRCNFAEASIGWSNTLTGLNGQIPFAAEWIVQNILLQAGDNGLVFTAVSRDGAVASAELTVSSGRNIGWFSVSDTHFNPPPFDGRKDVSTNNTAVINAINSLAGQAYPDPDWGAVQVPRAVTHTGDCTDRGYPDEWAAFTAAYGVNGEGLVKYPVYDGYGNHDSYDAYPPVSAPVNIAQRNVLRENVWISSNGYHYSWDWEDVHFVQVNIYPGNTKTYCQASLDFLRDDLKKRVGQSGRPVIILQHFGFDSYSTNYWSGVDRETLYSCISNYNVAAILHGHNHNAGVENFHGISSFSLPSSGYLGMFTVFQVTDNSLRVAWYDAAHTKWAGSTNIPVSQPQLPQLQVGINGSVGSGFVTLTGSCNFAVWQLEWTNLTQGTSGTIPGTAEWVIPDIPVQEGANVIRVSARDASGNLIASADQVVSNVTASLVLRLDTIDAYLRGIVWDPWPGAGEYFVNIATNSTFDSDEVFLPGYRQRQVVGPGVTPTGLVAGVCYYIRVSAAESVSGEISALGKAVFMIPDDGDPGNGPELRLQAGVQDGRNCLRFLSSPTFAYILERCTNLVSNIWDVPVGQNWLTGSGDGKEMTVFLENDVFPAFYRARVLDRSPGDGSGFQLKTNSKNGRLGLRFLQSPAFSYTLECCTNLITGVWFVPQRYNQLLCTDEGAEMTLFIEGDVFPAFYRVRASSF